jgi:hypothetical protein
MTMDMHFGPRSAEGWVELEGDSSVVQSGMLCHFAVE